MRQLLVAMAVVDVRVMGVPMNQPPVRMLVSVRLDTVPALAMIVPMMLVMNVAVRVDDRLVHVQVLVTLREVQPHA